MFGAKKVSYFSSRGGGDEEDPYNFDASITDFTASKKKGPTTQKSKPQAQPQQQKVPVRVSNPNESALDRASSLLKAYGTTAPAQSTTNRAAAYARRVSQSYDEDDISIDDDDEDQRSGSFSQSRSSFSQDKTTTKPKKLSATAAAGATIVRGLASASVYEPPKSSSLNTVKQNISPSAVKTGKSFEPLDGEESISLSESMMDSGRINESR
jgi:hypothetical protein